MTRAAGIGTGTMLLDVGCGTGGFCRHAAREGALVHGIDTDADRIAAARAALPAGDFRVAPLQDLPWLARSFDVVTGFNVFQYAPDIDGALLAARRVARSSGRVAVCKWGPPATNEFFAFLAALDPERLALGTAVADPVDAALERLGVEVVAAGHVPAPIVLAGEEALLSALAAAGARGAGEEDGAWRARVLATAAPFRRADGSYRFDNRLVHRVFV